MVQMNGEGQPVTLRVKFRKVGTLCYISHLDLVRTMYKVIVRAGLPLKYSEGFNPKPKMTFAAPLSIGTESECEFMDVRLTERRDPEELLDALNKNLTDESRALAAYYPERKLSDLGYLSYRIVIDTAGAGEALAARCDALLHEGELLIEKKGKAGIATVNIAPGIREASVRFTDGKLLLFCTLSAAPTAFLNPEHLIRVLHERLGILSDENLLHEGYTILRTAAYFDDMTEFV